MSERTVAIADDVREMLKQSSELLNEVRWGADGYLERIGEMMGNFPGGSGSGTGMSKGSHSDPTSSAADKRDPGRDEWHAFRKEVKKVYLDVLSLHRRWKDGREPRPTPPLHDPGCELCSTIPRNHADTYTTRTITEQTTTKKGRIVETTQEFRVCYWCYCFHRRTGRLPVAEELAAHAEGRRVRVDA